MATYDYTASAGRAGVAAVIGNHANEVICVTTIIDASKDLTHKGTDAAAGDKIALMRLGNCHKIVGVTVDTDAITGLAMDIGFADAPANDDDLDNAADSVFAAQSFATAAFVQADKAGHTRLVNRHEEPQMLVGTLTGAATVSTGIARINVLIAPVDTFSGQ